MVSQQSTQPAPTSHVPQQSDESVRITAIRRQAVIDHLRGELAQAQLVAASEGQDLSVKRRSGQPCAQAEVRASNAMAIAQHLGATLKAYEGNRDFKAVQ